MTSHSAELMLSHNNEYTHVVDTMNTLGDEALRESVCQSIRELDAAIGRPPFPNPCTTNALDTARNVERLLREVSQVNRIHILCNKCKEVEETLPLLCAALPQGSAMINQPCLLLYETLLSALTHVLCITHYQQTKIIDDALKILHLSRSTTLIRLLHAANVLTPSLLEQVLFPTKECTSSVINAGNEKNNNHRKVQNKKANIISVNRNSCNTNCNSNSVMPKDKNTTNVKAFTSGSKKANKSYQEETKIVQSETKSIERKDKYKKSKSLLCNDHIECAKPSVAVIHTLLDLPLSNPCKCVLLRLFDQDHTFSSLVGEDSELALHIMSKYVHTLSHKLHPFAFLSSLNKSTLSYFVNAFHVLGELSDILEQNKWKSKLKNWSMAQMESLCKELHVTTVRNNNALGILFTAAFLLTAIDVVSNNDIDHVKDKESRSEHNVTTTTIRNNTNYDISSPDLCLMYVQRIWLWECAIKSSLQILRAANQKSCSNNATLSADKAKETVTITSNTCSTLFSKQTMTCISVLEYIAKHEMRVSVEFSLTNKESMESSDWNNLNRCANNFYKTCFEHFYSNVVEVYLSKLQDNNEYKNDNIIESACQNNNIINCDKCKGKNDKSEEIDMFLSIPLFCVEISTWLLTLCSNVEGKFGCLLSVIKLLSSGTKINNKQIRDKNKERNISSSCSSSSYFCCCNSIEEMFNNEKSWLQSTHKIQMCNTAMWNTILDFITLWGWHVYREAVQLLTNVNQIKSVKQIQTYLEELQTLTCEEHISNILCIAVRTTGRVCWLTPLLLLSLSMEVPQLLPISLAHSLSIELLFRILTLLIKIEVQDKYDKCDWRSKLTPLTRLQVIGLLYSCLNKNQLCSVAIEVIAHKLDQTLLHVIESGIEEVRKLLESKSISMQEEEHYSLHLYDELWYRPASLSYKTILERCCVGLVECATCLKEQSNLYWQCTMEANQQADAAIAEQLLEEIHRTSERKSEKLEFDKKLNDKVAMKQQEQMEIRNELIRRNKEKEEKDAVARMEAEERLRSVNERATKEERERKEKRIHEQRCRLTAYQQKMLNSFNVATFLDHLELPASRKWYIQEAISHHCIDISPDDLLEFIITGNKKVPDDMCSVEDNDMPVNKEDASIIPTTTTTTNTNNNNNNNNNDNNSSGFNTAQDRENEDNTLEQHKEATRELKKKLNDNGKYDLWKVVMNKSDEGQDVNDATKSSNSEQVVIKKEDEESNAFNNTGDAKNTCSFHCRLSPVLDLFSYEGGNEYGDLPFPLPSINIKLASKIIDTDILKTVGYANLLEALRSLERRELICFSANCTSASLTILGFRYHFPFHNSAQSLHSQIKERKTQILRALQTRAQEQRGEDDNNKSNDVREYSSNDSQISVSDSNNNDDDDDSDSDSDKDDSFVKGKSSTSHIIDESKNVFLPEVTFDI